MENEKTKELCTTLYQVIYENKTLTFCQTAAVQAKAALSYFMQLALRQQKLPALLDIGSKRERERDALYLRNC